MLQTGQSATPVVSSLGSLGRVNIQQLQPEIPHCRSSLLPQTRRVSVLVISLDSEIAMIPEKLLLDSPGYDNT